MYLLELETEFSAAHAIVIRGERERTHGHNFRVTVAVAGERLDEDGLLCDFHLLEASIAAAIAPFRDGDLNAMPPFDRINPTAEHIARHLGERLAEALPEGLRIDRVRVTEATGCAASYCPGRSDRKGGAR